VVGNTDTVSIVIGTGIGYIHIPDGQRAGVAVRRNIGSARASRDGKALQREGIHVADLDIPVQAGRTAARPDQGECSGCDIAVSGK